MSLFLFRNTLTGYKCQDKRDPKNTVQNYYIYIIAPTLLITLPSLAIILFNLLLWRNIHLYTKRSRYNTKCCINGGINSIALTSRNRPSDSPKDFYHFIMLLIGVSDLPLNLYYLYLNIGLFFGKRNDFNFVLNFFLEIVLIGGHSVNILIYLAFHRSFRLTASKIFNKVFLLCLHFIYTDYKLI